ncbi:hypothetical protein PYCC9005_003702 [Savitreella phatthalungensis]
MSAAAAQTVHQSQPIVQTAHEHIETPYSKADLNNLVLSFLVIEGYETAAAKFAQEANITPKVSTESISERVQIRTAIIRGDITRAITLVNELDPELLDTDPTLHFMLLRLHLIELIRAHLAAPSPWSLSTLLDFATSHLAPRAQTSPACLTDLEQTMSLLCFPHDVLDASARALLSTDTRHLVADRVNEALLESQGIVREAKLRGLVRLFLWQQGIQEKERAAAESSHPQAGNANGGANNGDTAVASTDVVMHDSGRVS